MQALDTFLNEWGEGSDFKAWYESEACTSYTKEALQEFFIESHLKGFEKKSEDEQPGAAQVILNTLFGQINDAVKRGRRKANAAKKAAAEAAAEAAAGLRVDVAPISSSHNARHNALLKALGASTMFQLEGNFWGSDAS